MNTFLSQCHIMHKSQETPAILHTHELSGPYLVLDVSLPDDVTTTLIDTLKWLCKHLTVAVKLTSVR